MTSIDDFKDSQGNTDWKKYQQAEIMNGERCYECEGFIGFSRESSKRLCYNCKHKDDKEEWNDDSRIRCPKCKYTWDVNDGDFYPAEEYHQKYLDKNPG